MRIRDKRVTSVKGNQLGIRGIEKPVVKALETPKEKMEQKEEPKRGRGRPKKEKKEEESKVTAITETFFPATHQLLEVKDMPTIPARHSKRVAISRMCILS